ncbi:hypothetical protein [Leucobacter massiliensis]|uniref:Transcriptional regulator, AbiEi antitoxin, Type IV TA system n=1 Tax=Leucobacter massiliensis TaxID=1686285 RepID=A0A2S9QM70_9MICO|nr:hypothetical protein [Leucobacter massiliensis]PRI10693.1 hypothetical protein B4915_07250 [Leucobacter massiliensis]
MNSDERIHRLRETIAFRAALLRGMTENKLRSELRDGSLVRVAAGAYAGAEAWTSLSREDRHLAVAIAADHHARRRPPLFCRVTAAALWGLPLYGVGYGRVDVLARGRRTGDSSATVRRHLGAHAPEEIVERGGLLCTTLQRTLLDVARFASTEQALPILDAGLRFASAENGAGGEAWAGELGEQLGRLRGQRGVGQARQLLGIADPRSDSVAESLSRLQLHRLGYEVESQVEVPSPSGGAYRVDFELVGLGVFGEVDGRYKYTDEGLLAGREAREVVLAEKAREDWIRGVTGKRVVRWGFQEARTPEALAARLRAFGVPIPGLRRSAHVAESARFR